MSSKQRRKSVAIKQEVIDDVSPRQRRKSVAIKQEVIDDVAPRQRRKSVAIKQEVIDDASPKKNRKRSSAATATGETVPKNKSRRSSAKEEEVYEVSSILEHKCEGNDVMFSIKWKGYDEATWEPVSSLQPGANQILQRYLRRVSSKRGSVEEMMNYLRNNASSTSNGDIVVQFVVPQIDKLIHVRKAHRMEDVKRRFCRRVGFSFDSTHFVVNGHPVADADTASSLGLEDHDTIEVVTVPRGDASDPPVPKSPMMTALIPGQSSPGANRNSITLSDSPLKPSKETLSVDTVILNGTPCSPILQSASFSHEAPYNDRAISKRQLLKEGSGSGYKRTTRSMTNLFHGNDQSKSEKEALDLMNNRLQAGTPVVPYHLFGAGQPPKEIEEILEFVKFGSEVLVVCVCTDGSRDHFTYHQIMNLWPKEFDDFMKKFILEKIKA